MTRVEFRCNCCKADRQIFNAAFLQACFKLRGEMAPTDQAGTRQADVEVAEDAAHGQRACPPGEVVHFLRGVAAADDSTDRSTNDHIRHDAVRFQSADHAYVGKTAGGAAAEREPDGWTPRSGLRVRRGFRRTVAVARSRE